MSKNLKVTSHKVVVDKLNKCEFTGLYQIQAKLNILCDYDPNDTEISTLITELRFTLHDLAKEVLVKHYDKREVDAVDKPTVAPQIVFVPKPKNEENQSRIENNERKIIDNEPYVSLVYINSQLFLSHNYLMCCVAGKGLIKLRAIMLKHKYWVREEEFRKFQRLHKKIGKYSRINKKAA